MDTNLATALASLNALTKLTLSDTNLRQLPDNFLIGLSSLRELDISFNQGANSIEFNIIGSIRDSFILMNKQFWDFYMHISSILALEPSENGL